ncbi:MAG: tRNA (adenosine(37)-N6)-threonylcarbamoyltransferase complex dimerization subunit type 1 TsaB [Bacillota bacterium]
MRVLGVDSATSVASVAIVEDDQVRAEIFLNTGTKHAQSLMIVVNQVLENAGLTLSALDGLAVVLGPGSFTGLRIGLATVKGLALVTGLPVIGIPTLDGLAMNAAGMPGLICPILNARKNEVYTAIYRSEGLGMKRVSDYLAVGPQILAGQLTGSDEQVTFLGDGWPVYREILQATLGDRIRAVFFTNALPRASQIAWLGLSRLRAGEKDDLHGLTPLYIRPSEAEIKWAQKNCAEGENVGVGL